MFLPPSDALNELLLSLDTAPVTSGVNLADLIKRPQVSYKDLAPFDITRPVLSDRVCEKVEIEIKYEGYINRQIKQVEEMKRLEDKKIPADTDYNSIHGLRLEAKEKLSKIKPESVCSFPAEAVRDQNMNMEVCSIAPTSNSMSYSFRALAAPE